MTFIALLMEIAASSVRDGGVGADPLLTHVPGIG